MAAIRIENLTKKYKDVTAVDDLTLAIEEGETFALLGVNGAGKTTTVKMLCGLTQPTSGEAYIYDRSVIKEVNEVKKLVSVSMQETAVGRNLTVKENLDLFAELYGLEEGDKKARIERIVERFDFSPILNKRAKKLSGGWQRKVSIALAILAEPKVMFLDEPTLGLDVLSRRELWRVLEGMKGKTTVVLTTHYMEEAEALADRIAVMKNGRLLTIGTAEELKKATSCEKFEDAFIKIVENGGVL